MMAIAWPAIAGDAAWAESVTPRKDFLPFDGPRPIVAWVQTVIWTGAGGALPTVVVYEDGELVFAQETAEQSYRHRRLQGAELGELKSRIVAVAGLAAVKRRYDLAPFLSDALEELLYVQSGGREVVTDVYGLAERGDLRPGEVPAAILELRGFLAALARSEGGEWRPRYVEVSLVPERHTSSRTLGWPGGWPGLDSDRAVKRKDGYSILLDAPLEAELLRLLAKDGWTRPFRIGGRRWSVASTRPVFPREPVWVKAFDDAFR